MKKKKQKGFRAFFDKFASTVTKATGRPASFFIALVVILVWAITGPLFGFSDTWQLVINTGTTIITFLMVFVIQQSQNKETVALHLKLNELIAATKGASNRLIDIEDLTEEEIDTIKGFYVQLSKLAAKERNLLTTHTIEEAHNVHKAKKG